MAMKAIVRISVASLATAACLLCSSAGAIARNAGPLTDRQLDGVTAGGFVFSTADAAATGAFNLTQTGGVSIGIQEISPYPDNPGLGANGGAAEGTAVAVGSNVTVPNQPPPTQSTAVQTGGGTTGNMVVNHTFNYTAQGVGGVQAQVGWTFVYGAWIGL